MNLRNPADVYVLKRSRKKIVADDGWNMSIAKNVALFLLRGYQAAISPWLPASCRYVPTCSEYAMEAVERFGAIRGSWMALRRILRCQPFVRGGYDPVQRHSHEIHSSSPACGSN